MSGTVKQNRSRTLSCALVVALFVFGPSPTAAVPPPPDPVGPSVVYGSKQATIELTSSLSTVARLDVPRGKWIAWAHLWMAHDNDGIIPPLPAAQCLLASDANQRPARSHAVTVGNEMGRSQLVLNLAYDHGADGGAFHLRCRETDGQAIVSDIRMVAYRVGRLTTVPMAGGAGSTVGSSIPYAVHGVRDAAVSFGSTFTTIGQLDLEPGRWWIRATMNLGRTSGESWDEVVACRLSALDAASARPVEIDHGRTMPVWEAIEGGQKVTVLEMTHAYPIGSAALVRLTCSTSDGTATAGRVRITALKLGRLQEVTPSDPNPPNQGSGWPRVISGAWSGVIQLGETEQTIVEFPTPAGRWLLSAKVELRGVDELLYATPRCRLVAAFTRDTTREAVWTPGFRERRAHRHVSLPGGRRHQDRLPQTGLRLGVPTVRSASGAADRDACPVPDRGPALSVPERRLARQPARGPVPKYPPGPAGQVVRAGTSSWP